jgi:hypothetical protein
MGEILEKLTRFLPSNPESKPPPMPVKRDPANPAAIINSCNQSDSTLIVPYHLDV